MVEEVLRPDLEEQVMGSLDRTFRALNADLEAKARAFHDSDDATVAQKIAIWRMTGMLTVNMTQAMDSVQQVFWTARVVNHPELLDPETGTRPNAEAYRQAEEKKRRKEMENVETPPSS